MKLTSIIVALMGCLASIALAETITLAWDANAPQESVTEYELRYGTDPEELAGSIRTKGDVTQVALDLPAGIYHFEVVAIAGNLVSRPSARITYTVKPSPPSAPQKLRVVEIQTSANLRDWKTIAMIPQTPDTAPAEFVRARLASIAR